MRAGSAIRLAASIGLCQAAGLAGSVFTASSVSTWYVSLEKPFFTPPAWVFAPVWITLYTLMGIALFRIWERGIADDEVRRAMLLFFAQLAMTVLWCAAFFGGRSVTGGLFAIAFLWFLILQTILTFRRLDPFAGALLIPYIAWVSFAAALNAALAALNR